MADSALSCRAYMVLLVFLVKLCSSSGRNSLREECAGDRPVCTTMLLLETGKLDKDKHCACPACGDTWWHRDQQSLTWPHYERGDWLVQYRFCEPVIGRRKCSHEDHVAGTMLVSEHEWDPRMPDLACACHRKRYYLAGWNLVQNEHPPFWKYEFICDRHTCAHHEACVKHYLLPGSLKSVGFRFPCSCGRGLWCPSTNNTDADIFQQRGPDGVDGHGQYILGYCEKLPPKRNGLG